MHPTEVTLGAAIGRSYAYYIIAGTRIPHPRHYPNLVVLAGVELPRKFAPALSASEPEGGAITAETPQPDSQPDRGYDVDHER